MQRKTPPRTVRRRQPLSQPAGILKNLDAIPRRANSELNATNSELNRTDHGSKPRLRELSIVDFQALAPERLPDVSIPSSAPCFQLNPGPFGRSATGGLTPEIWDGRARCGRWSSAFDVCGDSGRTVTRCDVCLKPRHWPPV